MIDEAQVFPNPDSEPLGDGDPTIILDPPPAETPVDPPAETPAVEVATPAPVVWEFPPPPPQDLLTCLDYLRNEHGRPPEYRMTATMRLRDFLGAADAWYELGAALAAGEEAGYDGYALPIIRAGLEELARSGDMRAAAVLATEGICRGTGWAWTPLPRPVSSTPTEDKASLRLNAFDVRAVGAIGAFLGQAELPAATVLKFALHYAALMLPEGQIG